MKKFIVAVAMLLISGDVVSQDTITTTSGERLTGIVDVSYNLRDDVVTIDDKAVALKSIKEVALADGRVMVPRMLQYFVEENNTEIKKTALLQPVLSGDATLYEYDGMFKYALEVLGNAYALQDLPTKTETVEVQNYKTTLLMTLVSCLDRELIFESKFTRNRLLYLVNTYNLCNDENYVALENPIEKTTNSEFGIEIGSSWNKHDLFAPVYIKDNSINGYSFIGFLDQKGAKGTGLTAKIVYRYNLFNLKAIIPEISFLLSTQKFEFIKTQAPENFPFGNYSFSEMGISIGPSFLAPITNKLQAELNISGQFNYLFKSSDIGRLVERDYALLHTKYTSDISILAVLKSRISYQISENLSVYGSLDYSYRINQAVLTEYSIPVSVFQVEPKVEWVDYQPSDRLFNELQINGGVLIKFSKTGYF